MSVRYRFATYEIDSGRRELRRAGDVLEVQPKVLDVLVHLVEGRDRVVTRKELLDDIWGDAAVSEGVLTTAIHAARTALGDSASRGWAIKTVSRRGYRFVAPVTAEPAAPRLEREVAAPSDGWASDAFVGRGRCLARVDAAFAAASSGRGRVLTVAGESGMGKTRLLDEIASHAPTWGGCVFSSWCDGHEGAPPYAPWIQVLRHLVSELDPGEVATDLGAGAPDLVSLVPGIRDVVPDVPEPPPVQAGHSRFRLFESIATFLGNVSRRQPLLIFLDDLQSADDASLRLLAFIAREIRRHRILIVVTLRENAGVTDPVLEETLAELAHQFPGERVALEGLERDEVAALVTHLMTDSPTPDLIDVIVARSEGNPFFVKEIVSLLDSDLARAADAKASWASRVPPGVRDVILGRLHRRSDLCQEVLRAASVLGRDFSLEVAGHLVERPQSELTEGILEAVSTGFVREETPHGDAYRFTHGLLHETVYDSIGSSERRRLHARAGDALEAARSSAQAVPPAELAHHFLHGGDNAGLAKAVEYATRAGAQASAVHAHDEAARHYDMALDALERVAPPDDKRRCELLIALGAARIGARMADPLGRDSLIRAAEIALETGQPDQLARAVLQACLTAMQNGPGDAEVTRLLEAALEAIDESEITLRARLMANLAFQLLSPETYERGLAFSNQAVELARKSGDPAVLSEALNLRCAMHGGPDHARKRLRDADDLLDFARDAGQDELGLFGYRWRLLTWLELGQMEEADRELAAYDAAAAHGRIWSARWYGLTLRAARAYAEARFDAAERMLVEGFAHRREQTTPLIISTFSTQLFWLRREQGRLDEVRLLDHRSAAEPHMPFRVLRTLSEAEAGRLEEAREQLRGMVRDEITSGPHDFTFLYGASVLTETCALVEDEECARVLYDVMSPYADQFVALFLGTVQLGSVSRYLGRLATLLGEWDLAEEHFRQALAANTRIGAHLWMARTRLDWARMLELRGGEHAARARELVQPCLADAHERGMTRVDRGARELIDRLPF